jgi:hypothetical protein
MNKYHIIFAALAISIIGALVFAVVLLSDPHYAYCEPRGYTGQYCYAYANLGDYYRDKITTGIQDIVHHIVPAALAHSTNHTDKLLKELISLQKTQTALNQDRILVSHLL